MQGQGEDRATYVLGHSAEEQERLDRQGALLRPFTEEVLRAAGIGPGMRVLDVGCGTGDVTLLAAELVGPSGAVVGVDRSPPVLATAATRAAARNWKHVSFLEGDVATMTVEQPFDAVVGRLVLMYQADPAAALRHLATLVRVGAPLAFVEIVMAAGHPAPGRDLFVGTFRLVVAAFDRAGAHVDMGLRLAGTFRDAGLPTPVPRFHPVTVVGPDRAWMAMLTGVARTLAPVIERFGLATADDLAIDTLYDRLLAEAAEAGNAVAGPFYVGAIARRPAA